MSRMPPVKTTEEVEQSIPEQHKEENIFVEQKVVDIKPDEPNLDLTIQPVKKPKRTYKKSANYMSQKKKDQLARARKKASAYKRKQTIAKAQQYLDEEKIDYSADTIEPDTRKFNIDYEKMSEMMMNKFETRMRQREEAQQRAKQELAEQERFKQEQERQKREWEMKIREDERKKIKGRFGQYSKQYRGQASSNLNNLMRPRGNGGTYGNFW
tara:strand:- start:107 stop:742 length:636 start_codon:yes stop_codon:yes gene_type:complete